MRVQPQREEPREKGMHGMLSIEIIVVPEIMDLASSIHLLTPPHDFPGGSYLQTPSRISEPDFQD
jgi:hypothetical protein